LAKPPVRRLARELGVDLTRVTPSGPGGVVTREDVQAAASAAAGASAAQGGARAASAVTAAAGATGDRETRVPIRSVRKATAEAVVRSAFTAPHVTEWLTADVTRSVRLLDRLRQRPELAGVRLTPLTLVARAFLLAVRRHPDINASWDEGAQEIVLKHYINLGIAAATARGLVVPTIKDADRLDLPGLASAIDALVRDAREGRTPPTDMVGGTVSITNVGVFGVDGGTPILPPGQSAILAVGAIRPMPWVRKGRVVPRQVVTLALSFDHRLVDGELGSKVLAEVASILEDPALGYALHA
jgi:pyruvate dehydrogenase E2 component (dihydrolipoamide acetyltransferase)